MGLLSIRLRPGISGRNGFLRLSSLSGQRRLVSDDLSQPPKPGPKQFLVTTPIYYVNSKPHLGHLYSSLLADTTARFMRLELAGRYTNPHAAVLFSTGTDEHGQKVQEAAAKAGQQPQAFCDAVSGSFQALHDAYAISNDDFVRTTDPRHASVVRWLWRRLQARGAIYLGSHAGWYCRSDETFLTELQVCTRAEFITKRWETAKAASSPGVVQPSASSDGTETTAVDPELQAQLAALSAEEAQQRVSVESGHTVEWLEEPNYRFRLGSYQPQLLAWLEGRLQEDGSMISREQLVAEAAPASVNATATGTEVAPDTDVSSCDSTYNNNSSSIDKPSETAPLPSLDNAPVWPPFRAHEVRQLLESPGGLHDLSVSRLRDKVSWAIPVPTDVSHSVYVWLDALANYLTVAMRGGQWDPHRRETGFGASGNDVSSASSASQPMELPDDVHWQRLFPSWPADVHVVGKDILKFHAVYWPAFLIAAGLPPPRRIVAHGHWTVGRVKMSKSLGNVVDPMLMLPPARQQQAGQVPPSPPPSVLVALPKSASKSSSTHSASAAASSIAATPSSAAAPAPIDHTALQRLCLSPDSIRYFLLREGSISGDGDFGSDMLAVRAIGDCADVLGNLASRVLNAKLLPGGGLPLPTAVLPRHFVDRAFPAAFDAGLPTEEFERINLSKAEAKRTQQPQPEPTFLKFSYDEQELGSRLQELSSVASSAYRSVNPSAALSAIMGCLNEANKVFTAAEPWKLAKPVTKGPAPLPPITNPTPEALQAALAASAAATAELESAVLRLTSVMYLMLETLRVTSVLLQPAMPTKMAVLLTRLGFLASASGPAPSPGSPRAWIPGHPGSSWQAAVFGAVPPSSYARVDLGGGPLVLFSKPPPPPTTQAGKARP